MLIKRGRNPFVGYWALVSGIGETKKGMSPAQAVLDEVDCDLQSSFKGKKIFVYPVVNDEYVYETVVFVGTIDE
ncbi:hypothetical protein KKG41_03275 [Patescibacteria group bacterium]|nr:hypothetical protein [Patescibacteria group bacterium]MBU1890094.1 hypothetical protein [Patescibacteria group bacterium]